MMEDARKRRNWRLRKAEMSTYLHLLLSYYAYLSKQLVCADHSVDQSRVHGAHALSPRP